MSASTRKPKRPWTISKKAKQAFQVSRLIHIYFSTLFLALLIFFSVTGILINHTDWLKSDANEGEIEREIPVEIQRPWQDLSTAAWEEGESLPNTEALLGYLKSEYGLRAPKEVKFDGELKEITFDYQMPSSYVFVTALVETGTLRLEYRKFGFWQVMGDLHKGRNSGTSWAWLIDISAVGMIIFSVTGLFILLQNLKQRRLGLLLTVGGLVLPILIYYCLVPRFSGV